MIDWSKEFTSKEEQQIVAAGLKSLEDWLEVFRVLGGIRFKPRPYMPEREEQHDHH